MRTRGQHATCSDSPFMFRFTTVCWGPSGRVYSWATRDVWEPPRIRVCQVTGDVTLASFRLRPNRWVGHHLLHRFARQPGVIRKDGSKQGISVTNREKHRRLRKSVTRACRNCDKTVFRQIRNIFAKLTGPVGPIKKGRSLGGMPFLAVAVQTACVGIYGLTTIATVSGVVGCFVAPTNEDCPDA